MARTTSSSTTLEEIWQIQIHLEYEPAIEYFSFNIWTKLHRTTAYVVRFIHSLRRRNVGQNNEKFSTQEELARAEVLER